ncbi:MAG: thiamine phosphate synthase [Lentisphaerae bacterium]|nr:thiamine phosphate synthase [Lentisphaerota bacterium]
MRLEDAFLYVVLEIDDATQSKAVSLCEEAIAGGSDIVGISMPNGGDDASLIRGIVDICRRDEALVLITNNPDLVVEYSADGLHIDDEKMETGLARAIIGPDKLVGLTSRSITEAALALEVGADYLVHEGGRDCPAAFAALLDVARVPLFAGGIEDVGMAKGIVEAGVFRLCVDLGNLDGGDVRKYVSEYARLLGRCL